MIYVCKNFDNGNEYVFKADSDDSALYISRFHRKEGDVLFRLDTDGTFPNNIFKEVKENVKDN